MLTHWSFVTHLAKIVWVHKDRKNTLCIFTVSILFFQIKIRGWLFNLTNWIPFTQECFVCFVFEEQHFEMSSIYNHYFVVIYHWKRVFFFNLRTFSQRYIVRSLFEFGPTDTLMHVGNLLTDLVSDSEKYQSWF